MRSHGMAGITGVWSLVVGDMATWHHGADALLEMDIEALAATVSKWTHTSQLPGAMRGDALEAGSTVN
jgi:thiamine pyrophosphate-dependent acetolactate synthase large subunit-like protein